MEATAAAFSQDHSAGALGIAGRLARILTRAAAVLALAMLAACASRAAPDFAGRWAPVNRYAEQPREIPLVPAYTFSPSPVDGTLRTMLGRWSRDAKLVLSYEHASDFTLHQAVARIASTDLREALAQLESAYAAQGIEIAHSEGRIVVRQARGPGTAGPGQAPRPDGHHVRH